jgi:hypothetical protein
MGWIWSDAVGWISMNDQNVGACGAGGCGVYGVNVDPASRELTGFAWSDGAGWICVGTTCSTDPSCDGVPPDGALKAYLDQGIGTVEAHGWAKACNLGDDGWISLNCAEVGACASLNPYYKVVFNPATGYFNDVSVPGSSFAWNGTVGGVGYGYMDFSNVFIAPEGTATSTPGQPQPQCQDGVDNDLNGVDDCSDPACSADPACGEDPNNGSCVDGVDNNNNGVIDCNEVSCSAAANCQENPNNGSSCQDGVDNNLNGTQDCQEVACQPTPVCAETPVNGSSCQDGMDNNGNGLQDCQEVACQASPVCVETPQNGAACQDGIDNDGNGFVDCLDALCSASPVCVLAGEATAVDPVTGLPVGQDAACSDGTDNDGNGLADCADQNCLNAPICTPAWLQAKFGNVYAQAGISGVAKSHATYCLTSDGDITGFTSSSTCIEAQSGQDIHLPNETTGYQGSLGRIDIAGILSGRYGAVVSNPVSVPPSLDGKVYVVNGDYTLGATTFLNQSGPTARGNGLLVVQGNLTIGGNLSYPSNVLTQYVRNLASFGVIVMRDPQTGQGGGIYIAPGVTHIVGAYFAEDTLHTGTLCPSSMSCALDQPLTIMGLAAARRFSFERGYHNASMAAETIINDSRAVANPPPGMQEVSQSLPRSKDAF